MQGGGWISVRRAMLDHALFHQKPDRLYVWMWILTSAAWSETSQDVDGKFITVKRGQLLTSYRQMHRATGVGIKVIRNLIARLRAVDTIDTAKGTGRLLITICNYDKYQLDLEPGAQAKAHKGHSRGTQKNKRTLPVGVTSFPDPVKFLFDQGISLLREAGVSETKARSVIGKWRRDYELSAIIEAFSLAQKESATDPVAFITGTLQYKSRKGQTISPGERARKLGEAM